MLTICEETKCAGCMACVSACPTGAVSVVPGLDYYQPSINQDKCIDCGRCIKVCQQIHPALSREPLAWYQGWSKDQTERADSSSGGFASAIARSFILSGGVVCSCVFSRGQFRFAVAKCLCEISKFRGSKYVKSNPEEAYPAVKNLLAQGQKVLFIALPCQVSAMKNYVGERLDKLLYTIDLICHGTPSPRLLKIYLREHGISLNSLDTIGFRKKTTFQISCDGIAIETPGIIDRYLLAFLSGLCYTRSCYSCTYASISRVADITLGDSWGSALTSETERGISLALCQTLKGDELLRGADLVLCEVDVGQAIANNKQLRAPSKRDGRRDSFLKDIEDGVLFERSIRRYLPKQCLKQDIKRILIRFGLWKR